MTAETVVDEVITAQQIFRYRREGYLSPVRGLRPHEVSGFRAALERVEARLVERGVPSGFTQPHLHFRWARDLATHPRILDAVERLIGPDVLVHSSSVFSKPPRHPGFVSWHQDGHYWDLGEPELVSAWVALSESTIENGCVRVLPGTHLTRVLHRRRREQGNMLASALSVDVDVDEARAVALTLEPGEMSLHHVNLIHGSAPNGSGARRLGVAIRYVAPSARQAIEHHATVLARGRDLHGFYAREDGPPPDDDDRGIDAQSAFLTKQREVWIAQGRIDP